MIVKNRKKNSRQRGTKTHGWGAMKKHRGAGHRGGRGRAGSGKRGDVKKPSYQKEGKGYLGKHGFTSKSRVKILSININTIQEKLNSYIAKGLVVEKKGIFLIDISKLGYNKLLGTGNVTAKLEIKADYVSANVVEKVKKAGGNVEITLVEQKAEVEEVKAEKAVKEEAAEVQVQETAPKEEEKQKEPEQKPKKEVKKK